MTDLTQQTMNLPGAQAIGVASVEEYQFEPIKGYPMLQWQGKRPFRSTQYYPAQLKEMHGPAVEGWRNKVYWGDNLQVMSHLLKEYRGQVQLVYIDPPFDSKADYKKTVSLNGTSIGNDHTAFEEKQYTDIWTNDEYLQFVFERLILMRELLSDNGTIYLHLDAKKVHYLKVVMDEVFGPDSFLCQIIWKRISGNRKARAKKWLSVDDVVLTYHKTAHVFHPAYQPYSEEYKKRFTEHDDHGWYFWDNIGTYSQERLERLMAQDRVRFPENPNANPRIKNYLHEGKGVLIDNVWTDLPPVNSQASDATGYPTQKPEALLERIIRASSNPGDLVFDCFMGSGTTQAVAMKLGRRFIGADINLGAVQITTKRLIQIGRELEATLPAQGTLALGADDEEEEEEGGQGTGAQEPTVWYTGFEVYNVNNYDIFRNPLEAKALLLEALEVEPLPPGHVYDGEKDGRLVKVMPVNRIATRADLNELIAGFDLRSFGKRREENPNRAVEKITLVCMGHEPDLAAQLQREAHPYKLDVEVVDILRDKQELQFKRDAEARVAVRNGWLVIEAFYPMNLLGKLSMQKETVGEWRELVESVMVDWNYDGAVLTPAVVDVPEKDGLVVGRYLVPEDAGTVRVKITDLLSESWEGEVAYGNA